MKLLKYFVLFNGVYYFCQLAIIGIGIVFYIDIPSGASVAAIIAGALMAGRSFVLDHKRLPNSGEKWRLVLGSFAICVALSIVVLGAFVAVLPGFTDAFRALFEELGAPLLVLAVVVTALIYVAVMYFCYGFLLSRIMKDYGPEPPSDRQEPHLQ